MFRSAPFVAATLLTLGTALCGTPPASALPAAPAIGPTLTAASSLEKAGCYRLGETGYHWYRWCVGPTWVYPHHRACHHGECYYR